MEKTLHCRHSEERIWLAKYRLYKVASLGDNP